MDDSRIELLQRRIERERVARKQAEQIIEEKSRELYLKGQELEQIAAAERQARAEAEIMLQAFEAFTSKLDHSKILLHLEEFIKRLIPHNHSAIYFFEADELLLFNDWSTANSRQLKPCVAAASTLLDSIVQANHPIVIDNDFVSEISREWGMDDATQSWMVVGMSAHGRNIGCITLESQQPQAFSESSIRLVQALANESAIALENARLFQEVQKLSTVDPLTGLFNRRHFNNMAQQELQRTQRYNAPMSVILMDIDHFKQVNDNHGHGLGDQVLVDAAAVCMQGLRTMDVHARYGGEEFCFLLPETTHEGAEILAQRLREGLAQLQFESEVGEFRITASFGVAQWQAPEESIDNLLKRCDQALYAAKHGGRNRVVVAY